MKRFLLGFVSPEEARQVEQRFLRDDDFFEALEALEDELFYDYEQDFLNENEKTRFEEMFLNSKEGSEKLSNAKILLETCVNFSEEKSAWASLKLFFDRVGRMKLTAAAASALLLAAVFFVVSEGGGAGWFFNLSPAPEDDFARQKKPSNNFEPDLSEGSNNQTPLLAAEKIGEENRSNETLESNGELARKRKKPGKPPEKSSDQTFSPVELKSKSLDKKPAPPAGKKPVKTPKDRQGKSILALILPAGGSKTLRGGGEGAEKIKTVKLAPEVKFLRVTLQFALSEDYEKYSARVFSVDDGRRIWASTPLEILKRNGKKSLRLDIPSEILAGSVYEISLFGADERDEFEEIESFYFRIIE